MKKLLMFIALAAMMNPVFAAPKQADAEQWLADFKRERGKVHDALVIKGATKSNDRELILKVLRTRAVELFGDEFSEPYGSCIKAVSSLSSVWNAQRMAMVHAGKMSNIELSSLSRLAWDGGIDYWDCRMAIEPAIAADKLKQVRGRK